MTSATQRRSFPMMSIQRVSLMIILATLLVGQSLIVRELGLIGEMGGLYKISVWFLILYAFWPQLNYGLNSALIAIGNWYGAGSDE